MIVQSVKTQQTAAASFLHIEPFEQNERTMVAFIPFENEFWARFIA